MINYKGIGERISLSYKTKKPGFLKLTSLPVLRKRTEYVTEINNFREKRHFLVPVRIVDRQGMIPLIAKS